MKRLSMEKVKEIIRLKDEGFTYRDIALSVGCSKSVVGDTIRRVEESKICEDYEQIVNQLETELFPEKQKGKCKKELDMMEIIAELSRKNVTRQILWEEYKEENPDGLMYSQFCERIKNALKENKLEYHKHHNAGEDCEVDWAGSTIPYHDAEKKMWLESLIFVGVLPASSYPFVRAYPNQKTPSWIDAHIKMFRFFGGTPKVLAPDCTKTAVVTPDLFDPVITKTYQDMAAHYGITIIPARSRKPRDKNMVENTVGNVSRRIIAGLRNCHFTSIAEINEAIEKKLEEFINEPFKKMVGCRRSAFEQMDKPVLRPLPDVSYEYASFKTGKIGPNYHVEYDKFHYSVPYEYRSKEYTIRATVNTIEVFVQGLRICTHIRKQSGNRYVTQPEHLPENHKVLSKWNGEEFINLAGKYGENTVTFVKALLNSTEYPIQSYRMCMSVLRQAKAMPVEVVEKASEIAFTNEQLSSKYFEFALKLATKELNEPQPEQVIEHDNIRGANAFSGGINHA